MTFFSFLRGINVSGQKLIKMSELVRLCEDAGFKNVKTYLQSGNVALDGTQKSARAVRTKLERALADGLGYEVTVIVRTHAELAALLARDPFQPVNTKAATRYVTFFTDVPPATKLPLVSPKKNVRVIEISGADACSLSTTIPNGDYPNPFLEKLFKIPATTRNWNTLEKMIG
ncbi:DUF1697 domain-containing protein [candidate division KSB1 bacterium]|nr:DUF1697 domain-containing protein [candidate division KSB1 bacterium]